MDAFSGARELFIFVPFLLFNCAGFPLNISESTAEMKGSHCTISCCYDMVEQELQGKKCGLSLLSSDKDSFAKAPQIDGPGSFYSKDHIVSASKNASSHLGRFISKHLILSGSSKPFHDQQDELDLIGQKASLKKCYSAESTLKDSDLIDTQRGKVKACMYSPHAISSANEIIVRVSRCLPEYAVENVPNSSWSGPFVLVPPSGSSTVFVPQSSPNAAFIISVTSSALAGPFAGRTQAITFQPR